MNHRNMLALLVALAMMLASFAGYAEAEKEPITFRAFSTYSGTTQWGDDPISKEITRRTGVSLDIVYNVSDNAESMIGMMIAGGDLPDLFLSLDNTHLSQLIAADAVMDLSDYMVDGGANIKAVMGEDYNAMRSETDGKLYGFNRQYGLEPSSPNYTFNVSYALLKEFDYPEITTIDELADYVREYIELYPEYNGLDTIGFMTMGAGWTFNIGFNNAALAAAGFKDNGNYYVDDETLDVTIGIRTPEAKNYFKWLNTLAQESLFAIDSFTFDQGTFTTAASQGNVLVCMNPEWVMSGVNSALRQAGMSDRQFAMMPIYVSEEAAANSKLNETDSIGSWKSVISTSCSDPDRAFEFFDTMWSYEMQVLCNWGVEGMHYDIDENGKRVMKPEVVDAYLNNPDFTAETGIGQYTYWSCGDLAKDDTDQYILPFTTKEAIWENYDAETKEVLRAYNPEALTWIDIFPEPNISYYGLAWKLVLSDSSAGALAETKVNDELRSRYVYDLVTAESEDAYEAIWEEFVSACVEAGIEEREQEISDLLKARVKIWYGEE